MNFREMEDKILHKVTIRQNLSPQDIEAVKRKRDEKNCSLGKVLLKMGFVKHLDLLNLLEEVSGYLSFDPSYMAWPKDAVTEKVTIVKPSLQIEKKIFMRNVKDNVYTVGMLDPFDRETIDMIQCYTGCKVEPFVCHEINLEDAWAKFYNKDYLLDEIGFTEKEDVQNEDFIFAPLDVLQVEVSELVNRFMDKLNDPEVFSGILHSSAVLRFTQEIMNQLLLKRDGSDLHFEPLDNEYRVRIREDGVLKTVISLPKQIYPIVNARLKLMAECSLEPARKPIDARIGYNVVIGKKVEFRFSLLPTINGEKICMRVIDGGKGFVPLDVMGFRECDMLAFRRGIHAPQGMVLITGPTGSGKTTTLYSALDELNDEETCIDTAEDPVEANIKGVSQVYCDPERGMTFLDALKSFLRQDPDIIMIGEIRDKETGEIAIKAAMTGHLVISTLHTNDAPSTISRLLNMDIAPYLIASGVILIHAQRLVRKICSNCKAPTTYEPRTFVEWGLDQSQFDGWTFYKGQGCEKCNNTGLKGRMGLFEVLEITPPVQNMILKRATTMEICEKAREGGFKTLREDGYLKVREGLTTLDEVIGATS
ncbi:MAG: type IV-A pilus assembly ATPase PilB [Candidatus Wallbacteria bacterium HGW-Wallbacteria-1]|jgi:type IV pilus assembly protein PilB|uniref:Type IV-A pilus assembly ATPase PilB n=1 Tax=Candidatus Wallbacteria bacterium HGW-Wallbacteria-1 TaxID=2013854 RepID=A0A2N1PUF3_9BACT|nr:MAG: type IV-A pilus assembly ATPase PilB [Candidatus Wallbacteria bacterium HGW-Wallbacteria-1]